MKKVGAYEAKTHLPRLLDEVAEGEEITITKHGVSVAILKPVEKKRAPIKVIEDIRKFRKGKSLKGFSLKEMIKEGRK